MLGYKAPRGLMTGPQRPAAMPVQTTQAPGRGLAYRPLNPFQSLAGGGLQGVGQLLMALGSGRPELAGQAFSAGLGQFDDQQAQRADRARQDQLFDLEIEDRDLARTDRQAERDDTARQKSDYDAAVDSLVAAGSIDAAEGDAMKAGVGKLGDFTDKDAGPQSGLAKLKADLDAGRIDRATYNAAVKKDTYIAPVQPQQAPATNLITLVAPDGKTTRSYDSRDPVVKQLAAEGWVERDRSLFPAPPIGYQPSAGGTGVEPIPGGPADPNRPTEAQRNDFKKQTLALDNLEAALTDYETALDKYGSMETYGEGKGVLENAYANVLIQAKEAANLGALTGPDMGIMNQMVIAPNSGGQLWAGGASGVKGQIKSFRGQLQTKRNNLNSLYGGRSGTTTVPPPPPGFQVVK